MGWRATIGAEARAKRLDPGFAAARLIDEIAGIGICNAVAAAELRPGAVTQKGKPEDHQDSDIARANTQHPLANQKRVSRLGQLAKL